MARVLATTADPAPRAYDPDTDECPGEVGASWGAFQEGTRRAAEHTDPTTDPTTGTGTGTGTASTTAQKDPTP